MWSLLSWLKDACLRRSMYPTLFEDSGPTNYEDDLWLPLGCSGDLVSRLSSGPCGASYGLLWGLIGDAKWSY